MARTKRNSSAKKQRDPLPAHFKSLEEAAEFWETHDSADYNEYFKDLEFKVDIKRRTYLISLDEKVDRKVRAIAKKRRVATESLVSLWIEEKAS